MSCFLVVTSDVVIMPQLIYIKYQEEVVLSEIKRVDTGRPYVWQQDSVPCYTCRITQKFSATILPLTSDRHTSKITVPLDVLDVVERETNEIPCTTKDELKAKIRHYLPM